MMLSDIESTTEGYVPAVIYRKRDPDLPEYDKEPIIFKLKYLAEFKRSPVTNAEMYLDYDGDTVTSIVYYTMDFNNHLFRHEIA